MLIGDCYGAQSPETIQAYGFGGIWRYLGHQVGKCAIPSEIAADRDAGLVVGVWFEDSATNALNGWDQGVADAQFILYGDGQYLGIASLGYPQGCAIPLAVDFPPNEYNIGTVCSYFDGARSILGPAGYLTGVYGSNYCLDEVVGGGHAEFGAQTAAWSRVNGQLIISRYADTLQSQFGQTFDTNVLINTSAALWGITPVTPSQPVIPSPTTPLPSPQSQEDSMASFLAATTVPGDKRAGRVKPSQVWIIDANTAVHAPNTADLAVLEGQYGPQQQLTCATVNSYGKP
jgi:hypothetical protein